MFGKKTTLPQKTTERKKQDNVDLTVQMNVEKESSASEYLKEIEKHFESSRHSSPRDSDRGDEGNQEIKVQEYRIDEENVPQSHPPGSSHRQLSSKSSVKPAKVVFKKCTEDVSRAERANRMAHFEYIESGFSQPHEDPKVVINHKHRANNKLYSMVHKKQANRAHSHAEAKTVTMHTEQPLNLKKFSPKRFRRFPRFTIFLNKDTENTYEKENSISLNPQFLNFLMTPERAEIVDKGTH